MPKTFMDPLNPETYKDRDLVLSVRLLVPDRVRVERMKLGLDASRVAILRALIRAGLEATSDDPQKLAEHLVVGP